MVGSDVFGGFLVAWTYWISKSTTNAALAVAFIGLESGTVPAMPFWLLCPAFSSL